MLRKKHKDSGEGRWAPLDMRTPMVEHRGAIVARYPPEGSEVFYPVGRSCLQSLLSIYIHSRYIMLPKHSKIQKMQALVSYVSLSIMFAAGYISLETLNRSKLY